MAAMWSRSFTKYPLANSLRSLLSKGQQQKLLSTSSALKYEYIQVEKKGENGMNHIY